jgi:hypothetical protein
MLINNLTYVIIAVLITEAITEIVVKSELFLPVKSKIFELGKNNKFFERIHYLLDCGYCFSVWAGMFTSLLLLNDFSVVNKYIDWFLLGIVVHRLSNLFHNIMDRIYNIDNTGKG